MSVTVTQAVSVGGGRGSLAGDTDGLACDSGRGQGQIPLGPVPRNFLADLLATSPTCYEVTSPRGSYDKVGDNMFVRSRNN